MERVGEESLCDLANEALQWAQERCAEKEPEPEPEPEPGSDMTAEERELRQTLGTSNLSKYERSRRRHAELDRVARAIARPGMGQLGAATDSTLGARRHATEVAAQSQASDASLMKFDVEVLWADGSKTTLRAKDVATRLRPPLDKTVADDFASMPPRERYEDGANVRCLFDDTWHKATVVRSTPAAAVQVAAVQSDAERNKRFDELTRRLEQRGADDDEGE